MTTLCKRIVLLLIVSISTLYSEAQTFTDGDFSFRANSDGTCAVTGTTLTSGDLIIPSSATDSNGNNYSVTSIGSSAFSYRTGFTGSLIIPNSVTSIGDNAFRHSSKFTGSLTIPEGVTSIGNAAFFGCSGFTGSLTIPESVTSIGGYAFSDCSGFTGSLTIPEGVTSIGNYAFSGCSGFTGSLTIPNSVTSIGNSAFYDCSGFNGSLTIPEGVNSIGGSAFKGCSGLTGSLIIPNSVTSIGNDAFSGCSGFTGSLTIPNSVTSIGNYAFSRCRGFTGSLTIPESVTSIGNDAFYGCSGFTGSLTLGSGLERLGTTPFDYCNFTEINSLNPIPPTSITEGSEADVFTATNKRAILSVPTGSEVAYATSPVWSGFKFAEIEAAGIALDRSTWSTQQIGGTIALIATITPDNTTDKTVTWSSSAPTIASVDSNGKVTALAVGTATITATTANGLTATCSVEVKEVPASKISFARSSINLHIEHSDVLKATITPTSTTNKTLTWTSSNPTVASVDASGNIKGLSLGETIITATTSNNLTASCKVTVIPWAVGGIEYLRIPGGGENGEDIVKVIGGDPDVEGDLTIPEEVEIEGKIYIVVEIDDEVFKGKTDITKLIIPKTVVKVGNEAFAGCTNLVEVEAEDGTMTLTCGTDAFKGAPIAILYLGRNTTNSPFAANDALTELSVGKYVNQISASDFNGCTSIKDVWAYPSVPPALPDNGFEQSVYDNATLHVSDATEATYKVAEGWKNFVVTQGLNEILPESMTLNITELELKEKASTTLTVIFTPGETTNKRVTWRSSNPNVASVSSTGRVTAVRAGTAVITATSVTTTQDGVTPTATCTVTVVPQTGTIDGIDYEIVIGSGEDGKDVVTVTGGKTDPDGNLRIPEEIEIDGKKYPVTEIGDGAFKNRTDIRKLIIPATVVKVGKEAFAGCTNLVEVEAEDGEKLLDCGTDAFKDAPIAVLYLGRDTSGLPFTGKDSLTDLTFGDKVTVIDPADFEGCTAIRNITVYAPVPPEVYEESFEDNVYENATLRVPDESVEDYKADEVWRKFFNLLGVSEIRPIDIEMELADVELTEGESTTLKAIITPENADDKTVTWSSSDETVASVDATGLVTAIKAGTATITATTSNGLTASCTVTVKAKSAGIDSIESEGESAVRVEGGNIIAPEGSEVFDLSGRRVTASNLRPGIYIVRIPGGKAVKIRL